MTPRLALLLQIFEKLGAPLVAASMDISARTPDANQAKDAEQVAALLAKSVEASLKLSNKLDIRDSSEQADAVKLSLAALSSNLLSGLYRQTGAMPDDASVQKLTSSLEAVMTFADNFTPAKENTIRLETLEAGNLPLDEVQVNIQYVNIFVPVVSIISAFSFGVPDTKLAQTVADRLTAEAKTLREKLFAAAKDDEVKAIELGLLKALAQIYVQCHFAEMQSMMAMPEEERARVTNDPNPTTSLAPVWEVFERQLSVLEILAGSLIGVSSNEAASGAVAPAPAVSPVSPAQPDASVAPAAEQPAAVPPEQPQAPTQEEESGGEDDGDYNPMSFFKS